MDNIKLDTQQYSRAGPGSGPRRQQISHYLAFRSSEIFLFSCRVGVSYSPGQSGTGYVAKDDLGFLILQLPPLGAGVIKVCRHETKVVREHASSPRPPPLPFSVYYMEEMESRGQFLMSYYWPGIPQGPPNYSGSCHCSWLPTRPTWQDHAVKTTIGFGCQTQWNEGETKQEASSPRLLGRISCCTHNPHCSK